jgi:hypothetical protein
MADPSRVRQSLQGYSMIRKSGYRLSQENVLKQKTP